MTASCKSPLNNYEFSTDHMWFVECYMDMEALLLDIEIAHGRQNWRTYDSLLLKLQLMLIKIL